MAAKFGFLAAGLAVAVALSACTPGGANTPDETPSATTTPSPSPAVTTTSSPTPSESPTDPYAIPEVIDEAYVQRVLDKLWGLEAEALQQLRDDAASGSLAIPEDAHGTFVAIYSQAMWQTERQRLVEHLADGSLTDILLEDPGPLKASNVKLLDFDEHCLLVVLDLDSQSQVGRAGEPTRVVTTLLQKSLESVERSGNPTPWVLHAYLHPDAKGTPSSCHEVSLP